MASGGKRAGAGRKKKDNARVVLSCRVTSETFEKLRAMSINRGVGIGVIIDSLIQHMRLNMPKQRN